MRPHRARTAAEEILRQVEQGKRVLVVACASNGATTPYPSAACFRSLGHHGVWPQSRLVDRQKELGPQGTRVLRTGYVVHPRRSSSGKSCSLYVLEYAYLYAGTSVHLLGCWAFIGG